MSVLSVFIDESGDFGPYEHHCPYYLITLVFRDVGVGLKQPSRIKPATALLSGLTLVNADTSG